MKILEKSRSADIQELEDEIYKFSDEYSVITNQCSSE
jgi:hypothetical protein